MEYISESKFIKVSPRKLRALSGEVKKLRIDDALSTLTYSTKRGGKIIKSTLESALANAKNNFKVHKDNLIIKSIDIMGGPLLKRWRAVSKGAAHPYTKRTSHIRVVLEDIKPLPKSDKNVKVKENENGTKS